MSMTIGATIASLNIAKSVAAYFGLIESSSANISNLVHQAFKSALMNLELARTSGTKKQSEEYLKEARNKFIEAIAVEKDESLVSAFIGLAMCQCLLGDKRNAALTIRRINNVQLSNAEKLKAGAKNCVRGPGFFLGLGGRVMNLYNGAKEREANFTKFNEKAISEMSYLN